MAQWSPTLCNPMDCSLPGSSAHGISQARILEWIAISFSLLSHPGNPHSSVGKESACNAGDLGSIPGLRRSPGEGKGYPLQYSGLDNSMGYIVHRVTKSWTQLSDFHNNAIRHITRIVYLIRQLSWVLLIVVGGIVESMQELIIGNHLEGYQQICSKCLLLVVEVVCQIIRTNVFL